MSYQQKRKYIFKGETLEKRRRKNTDREEEGIKKNELFQNINWMIALFSSVSVHSQKNFIEQIEENQEQQQKSSQNFVYKVLMIEKWWKVHLKW